MKETSIPHRRAASSVDEFCKSYDIGRTTFYELQKQGKGPRLLKIGRRTLVTREADDEWRAAMEAANERESA